MYIQTIMLLLPEYAILNAQLYLINRINFIHVFHLAIRTR